MTEEARSGLSPRHGIVVLLRGWSPFIFLLVAYELMRDLASITGANRMISRLSTAISSVGTNRR